MKQTLTSGRLACLVGVAILGLSAHMVRAQGQPPPDHPAVTVRGQTYTPSDRCAI
jgi:hypothetical protein